MQWIQSNAVQLLRLHAAVTSTTRVRTFVPSLACAAAFGGRTRPPNDRGADVGAARASARQRGHRLHHPQRRLARQEMAHDRHDVANVEVPEPIAHLL